VNAEELDAVVRTALQETAPDLDGASLDADADFHDDLGLDSMDALNLAIAIHEATGIDIPEVDAPQLTSVATCVAYLARAGSA
jgi:acyl carrier protein